MKTKIESAKEALAYLDAVKERKDDFPSFGAVWEVVTSTYAQYKAEIIDLFVNNHYTIPEVARISENKLSDVIDTLIEAHRSNKIDMVPWIEKNISSKSLYKGMEYIAKAESPSEAGAKEMLGMDGGTYKFCALYNEDRIARRQEVGG